MPELPEVETTRRGVSPHVEGSSIEQVIIREHRLRWPVPDTLPELLTGSQLINIERRAKYLLFSFPQGTLIIHLGMSGSLRIVTPSQTIAKHDHADFVFSNGQILRFTDPRKFGAILWADNSIPIQEHQLLSHLGPEPLTDQFDGNLLFERSKKRSVAVKQFIMDNQVVVGVGNIYANEALFKAGIRPDRQAGSISRQRYIRLGAEIKTVLTAAIEQGGTTLKDFVGGDGKPGYFKQELSVYGRGGEACLICGKTLVEVKLGQRATVYCQRCQT
ncbi:bifunctional DNA-formamidopyrimidine glycosylase/DNA-(apurinic or apyrimidinic site) lyase [Endozoicomonas sp. SM1973]|uniref:Formamidopyrimidine-DNA glycosylase n=1 Tax=Spartinivicinus marinus TaxID=2994442 RepID=A0A853IBI6_9GAMM|nr:bifunctional DNA-formamidopyrimidine glycosylase/DNA-(apurinic or apyrimidinic site) lyase [Spartinivicinus marinus]MCX4027282.1 bifunctional DNA-formamidopyrimidine glycosylase/DNA-(apurinic or apyrimidinic site) lyase [Spartinivicinus marinus]NYZ67958.1 bifunctional DNA-formamidopyrimidine glycosylase/DNA-(apurinic or apyrimidinic site) lyase [Spartinivicinus marinus]